MRKPVPKQLSRREVQRRFPPGTWVVVSNERRIALLIGWSPTPPKHNPKTGVQRWPASWVATLLCDGSTKEWDWRWFRMYRTVEEHEER